MTRVCVAFAGVGTEMLTGEKWVLSKAEECESAGLMDAYLLSLDICRTFRQRADRKDADGYSKSGGRRPAHPSAKVAELLKMAYSETHVSVMYEASLNNARSDLKLCRALAYDHTYKCVPHTTFHSCHSCHCTHCMCCAWVQA